MRARVFSLSTEEAAGTRTWSIAEKHKGLVDFYRKQVFRLAQRGLLYKQKRVAGKSVGLLA